MKTKKLAAPHDLGMAQIDQLEQSIIQAHDDKVLGGNAEELARQRPAVVALAATIGERLREEYRRRTQ